MSTVFEYLKVVFGAFLIYLGISTLAFAQYSIPSESMVPSLEVGDRVIVSKFAYGYSRFSLPLNLGESLPHANTRIFEQMPERGDVIVFAHPITGVTMIKRLIGLPGDVIEMRAGVLFVNGVEVPRTGAQPVLRRAHEGRIERATQSTETLPGGVSHPVHEFAGLSALDTFGPYVTPAGHLFFMGDNRDNSLDSRWDGMGPVPMENLIGRAETVIFAPHGCAQGSALTCPRQRWFRPLGSTNVTTG